MDSLSVESPSAKEILTYSDEVHQPSNQEASRHAKRQGDHQEEQSRRVELEVGDELLAKDGKDGREDVQGKAVAAQETPPHAPFRGSNSVERQQGGNGEIGNQNAVQTGLRGLIREAGQQGKDYDGKPRGQEKCHEVYHRGNI